MMIMRWKGVYTMCETVCETVVYDSDDDHKVERLTGGGLILTTWLAW